MIEETGKLPPEAQRVICGFSRSALRQGALLCSQQVRTDVIEQRRRFLQTQRMTRSVVHILRASVRIDGKQIIHPIHDARCSQILRVQLNRVNELSSRMPTFRPSASFRMATSCSERPRQLRNEERQKPRMPQLQNVR